MRWPVVAIMAYVVLGLETAVKPELAISPSGFRFSPTFLVPFITFVALSGPTVPVLWVAVLLGLVADLYSPRDAGNLVVVGPYALGYMAGAYLVLVMRGLMFRRSPLSMIFLSILATAMAELVVVTIMTMRSVYTDPSAWAAGRELTNRMLGALYTVMTAGVLSLILFPLTPLFGFQDIHSRRFIRTAR
jgi:rod shape-determining protein MreD